MKNLKTIMFAAIMLLMPTFAVASDLRTILTPPERPGLQQVQDNWTRYGGLNVNYSSLMNGYSGGLSAGVIWRDVVALEVNYDVTRTPTRMWHTVGAMAWGRLPNSTIFTPMIGVGAGYRFMNDFPDTRTRSEPVFQLGAGVSVALTDNLDLVTRYRYTQGFNSRVGDHTVTTGLVFRF